MVHDVHDGEEQENLDPPIISWKDRLAWAAALAIWGFYVWSVMRAHQ